MMKWLITITLFTFGLLNFSAQDADTELLTEINPVLLENSGLLNVDGRILSHNDSGGDPILYEIDTLSGNIIRQVFISGANNVDWEDLAQNEDYIFIADIGNNNGDRQNLVIYRISKLDYLNTLNDTVLAEEITFSYEDQTNFSPAPFTTNYDAEALIELNNQLYIFSKNWGNQKTKLYQLPNQTGTHTAILKDSLDVQGLITAAEISGNKVLLTGYVLSHAFVYTLSGYTLDNFFDGDIQQYILPGIANIQVEGLTRNCGNYFFVSTEGNQFIDAQLFRLLLPAITGFSEIEKSLVICYPNPVNSVLNIDAPGKILVELINRNSSVVLISRKKVIDVSSLPVGEYIARITMSGVISYNKIIID